MIDNINQFEKAGSSVHINLTENPFDKDGSFVGKISRKTIGLNELIGGIIKKDTGVNANMIQNAAALLQLEILENLAAGNAVNILNLGVLYAGPTGSVKDLSSPPKLCAKFTTSPLANGTAAKLSVDRMLLSDTSPTIANVSDFYETEPERGVLTKDKMAYVTGDKLKLGGERCGIFFAPLEANEQPVSDESRWIKVTRIKQNYNKSLLFYVPLELTAGTKYRLIVRTSLSSGNQVRKAALQGISEPITVKDA